jgi:hypothetical protein
MAWNYDKAELISIPHVSICIPHFGAVQLDWVDSTYAPLKYIPQVDFKKSVKLARGIMNLDTERNELVRYALEDKTVTHILFVDTDCLMEEPKDVNQAVRTLLACNAPIVSGLYRAKKREGYPYAMWVKNPQGEGYLSISKWTGNWIQVSVIGFGFVLLKREVFERVPAPWFVWDTPHPSEDFAACEKFNKYGYSIKVYTDVRLSHCGMLKVKASGDITTLDV